MKILIVVLCVMVMTVTLADCSDYNCRRLARNDCEFAYELRGECMNKHIAICDCRRDSKTKSEKNKCDDLNKASDY